MQQSNSGQDVLQELTYKKLPKLYKHLQTTQCEMSIIATDWFLCLFATTLPSEVMSSPFCHFLSIVASAATMPCCMCDDRAAMYDH